MPIYKFATLGWSLIAILSVFVGMPYLMIYPGIYMLTVAYYFKKNHPESSYAELFAKENSLGRRLSLLNCIFVITCGYHIGVLENKFGRLYDVEEVVTAWFR